MSITRLALRQNIAKETGLGMLVTTDTAGSTTTLIDSTSTLTGAYSATRFPRGAVVRFSTLGGAALSTEGSTVDSYNPATGTVTLLPAVSTATHSGDKAEIWRDIDSPSRVDEAIDRALTRNCWRWVPMPLTEVPDGDMGELGVAHWAATAVDATPTKLTQTWPTAWGQRVLLVTNSGVNGYAQSDTIAVQAGDEWCIDVLAAVLAGAGVTLAVRDYYGAADITLSGDGGSYTGTGWKRLTNTFTIPTGCEVITIRLGSPTVIGSTYWTNVIAYQKDRREFTLPARISSIEEIGDSFYRSGEEYEDFHREPYVQYGRSLKLIEGPTGIIVRLDTPIGDDPVYLECLGNYDALATDAATTESPDDLALWSSIYQLYSHLAQSQPSRETKSGYITGSDFVRLRDEAQNKMNAYQRSLGATSRKVNR